MVQTEPQQIRQGERTTLTPEETMSNPMQINYKLVCALDEYYSPCKDVDIKDKLETLRAKVSQLKSEIEMEAGIVPVVKQEAKS